jgi:hypothetical protein
LRQVLTVTSCILRVPEATSVFPSCSNLTSAALGLIEATANVCADADRHPNVALARTASLFAIPVRIDVMSHC